MCMIWDILIEFFFPIHCTCKETKMPIKWTQYRCIHMPPCLCTLSHTYNHKSVWLYCFTCNLLRKTTCLEGPLAVQKGWSPKTGFTRPAIFRYMVVNALGLMWFRIPQEMEMSFITKPFCVCISHFFSLPQIWFTKTITLLELPLQVTSQNCYIYISECCTEHTREPTARSCSKNCIEASIILVWHPSHYDQWRR